MRTDLSVTLTLEVMKNSKSVSVVEKALITFTEVKRVILWCRNCRKFQLSNSAKVSKYN